MFQFKKVDIPSFDIVKECRSWLSWSALYLLKKLVPMMYYTYIYILLNDSENNISSIKMYIKFHENLIFDLEI